MKPRYYNWLKKIRKFTFLKYLFFENILSLSISRNSLQTPSLDDILLRNFTLSNTIISVKDLIRWKRGFDTFLIDHYNVTLEIAASLVSIKKFLYQCHQPYTRRVISHRVLYLKLLSTYNICIIYLHVIEACSFNRK